MSKPETMGVGEAAVALHNRNAPLFAGRYQVFAQDPYASAFGYGRKRLFGALFDFLSREVRPGAKILDAGCGSGYFLYQLNKQGYQAVGIEPAAEMYARATEINNGVEIRKDSITKISYPDQSFDAVTAIEVFRYLDEADRLAGYQECLRVVKPGGYLIITMVNRYALDGFWIAYRLHQLKSWLLRRPVASHCFFTTPRALKQFFSKQFGLVAETKGVLLAPLRIVYKVSEKLGRKLAVWLESLDAKLEHSTWHAPLAGHLIAIIRKP
jgi:SAM-dependent methyltransferase